MTKHQIIETLRQQLLDNEKLSTEDKVPRGTKTKIKNIKNAIEVIKELPPRCKHCGDKFFIHRYDKSVINCPNCNPYGETA